MKFSQSYDVIHVRAVKTTKHSVIISELSPQPFEHSIWQKLDVIKDGFEE
jgi:hypothetical protein